MSDFSLGGLMKVPRGTPDVAPLEFDLTELEKIELRKSEISYANKETAPELMYIFNDGYCKITRIMAQISYEYTQAKKFAEKRKSTVILDVAPSELNKRSLRSSEDLRQAVLNIDESYLALMDTVNFLEAVYERLRGMCKSFEMAYQSAKKVMDNYGTGLGSMHTSLTHSIEESPDVETKMIGRPKY